MLTINSSRPPQRAHCSISQMLILFAVGFGLFRGAAYLGIGLALFHRRFTKR
jgi:hypothetical protein